MIGAIAGDIIGSVYEHDSIKTKLFTLFQYDSKFTDDTVLTVAVAQAILSKTSYKQSIWDLGGNYPNAGYGASFIQWLRDLDPHPYNSWGNGAAMRVSPIGYAFNSAQEVLKQAKLSAEISHNHPEGIKGAQAVALGVYLARMGSTKAQIKQKIIDITNYDLDSSLEDIRPKYEFDVSSQGSVPQAIICFLESSSFEEAIRNAVSLGGDSDTQACIAGAIAEAYYKSVPDEIIKEVKSRLPDELWEITITFSKKYCPR